MRRRERRPQSKRRPRMAAASAPKLDSASLVGEPRLAELAALLLGGAAPDAGVLVGDEGEVEARRLGEALAADGLGLLDLLDCGTGGADREEEVGVGVAARGDISPIVGLDRVRLYGQRKRH